MGRGLSPLVNSKRDARQFVLKDVTTVNTQDAGDLYLAEALLYSESDTARMLAVSRALMRKWRRHNTHLPFVKLGSRVLYRAEDIATFVRQLGGKSQV